MGRILMAVCMDFWRPNNNFPVNNSLYLLKNLAKRNEKEDKKKKQQ